MAEDLPISVQQEIIEDFKTNPEVFETIYNHYFDQIFKYLVKRCASAEIAYDITGDTFLKAYNSFHKFQWKGYSVKVWLYRIATNALRDHYREKTLFIAHEDIVENHALVQEVKEELEAMDKALFGDNELQALNEAIDKLNPKYQKIVSLYYFAGLSQSEIGETIGRSPSAVKAMMHRAMTQLRQLMNE